MSCRWPDCTVGTASHHIVCDTHWKALPGFLRARIYQTGTFVDEHELLAVDIAAWVRAEFSGVDDRHDRGRWARLVRWVRERDAARAARRLAEASQTPAAEP